MLLNVHKDQTKKGGIWFSCDDLNDNCQLAKWRILRSANLYESGRWKRNYADNVFLEKTQILLLWKKLGHFYCGRFFRKSIDNYGNSERNVLQLKTYSIQRCCDPSIYCNYPSVVIPVFIVISTEINMRHSYFTLFIIMIQLLYFCYSIIARTEHREFFAQCYENSNLAWGLVIWVNVAFLSIMIWFLYVWYLIKGHDFMCERFLDSDISVCSTKSARAKQSLKVLEFCFGYKYIIHIVMSLNKWIIWVWKENHINLEIHETSYFFYVIFFYSPLPTWFFSASKLKKIMLEVENKWNGKTKFQKIMLEVEKKKKWNGKTKCHNIKYIVRCTLFNVNYKFDQTRQLKFRSESFLRLLFPQNNFSLNFESLSV